MRKHTKNDQKRKRRESMTKPGGASTLYGGKAFQFR